MPLNSDKYKDKVTLTRIQNKIPSRLRFLAEWYPSVTWNDAIKMYEESVNETLDEFGADFLMDIPYGQGYAYSEFLFKDKLEEKCKIKAEENK